MYSLPEKSDDTQPRAILDYSTATKTPLRVVLAVFGAILSTQSGWILMPEKYQTRHIALPLDGKTAALALAEQENINKAATVAGVRGDLWAQAAFTYSGQLWIDQAMELATDDQFSTAALKPLNQALRYSPHRGDVWLIFAALAHRYKWSNYQPNLLLKMSYYTAPNEFALLPLRLNLSLRAEGVLDEAELGEMVRRDITLILTRVPALKPALLAAHRAASPEGKKFAERVVADIDLPYVAVVRAKVR